MPKYLWGNTSCVDSGGVAYGEYVCTLDGDRLEDEYDEFVAIQLSLKEEKNEKRMEAGK